MSEYQFRHDRAGFTGALRVHIESTAAYGAPGINGLGQGRGFDDGIINLAGLLKMPDGSVYNAAGAVPGAGFLPAEHRLTVYRGATPISSLSFVPVETAPGVVDINTLLSQGKAVAATPAQLLSLVAVAAELATQNGTFGQTLTAIQAALADTEQSAAGVAATANSVPYANVAAFPASASATESALALNTGGVYSPGGPNWGNPIGYVQTLDTLIAQTLDAIGLTPGRIAGDSRQHLGRTYYWDAASTEAVDPKNPTVLQAAGGGVGRWIMAAREAGLNLKWFAYLVVNGDWTPALDAAVKIDSVFIPNGEFTFFPSLTNFIKIPTGKARNITGMGAGSVIKIADGAGNYQRLFGSADDSQKLTDVRLSRFAIHQNPDNNAGAIIPSNAATAQQAIGFYNFDGVTIDMLTFPLATGINTISLNGGGTGSRNARVMNIDLTWGRKLTEVYFDNSAVYINCLDHAVTNSVFRARSLADGATGAIETHGAMSIIADNRIHDFQCMINVTPFSLGVAELSSSSLVVKGNLGFGVGLGVMIWAFTGKTLRGIRVHDNVINIAQSQHPDLLLPRGIYVHYRTNGELDGDVDGIWYYDNLVVFEETETRTNLSYNSMAGIGLASNGNIRNAYSFRNTVVNAPFSAYVYGRAGKTITHLRAWDNISINAGTATAQTAQASIRAPLALYGLHIDSHIRGLQAIEDTATAQASRLVYFNLTDGSDIRIESESISAPNNPAIVRPTPPAGVTFVTTVNSATTNTFSKTQTFNVTGANAINVTSDTGYAVLANSDSGTAVYGKSNLLYGGYFVGRDQYALVAQQAGTAIATVNRSPVLIQRTIAGGAFNVTGPTGVVDDAATVTTGTRSNPLFEWRWDGTAKMTISGASHAMGAGIITAGGWGRTTVTLTPPQLTAGQEWESPVITIIGVNDNDSISLGPPKTVELGLRWQGLVTGFGQGKIRIKNDTGAVMTPAPAVWGVSAFRK